MKRTLVGAGLLAIAGVGSIALAPGGAAQENEPTWVELEAHFEPNPAEPGETVTLLPDEPCSLDVDGDYVSEQDIVVVFLGDEEVEVPVAEDGSWSFEVQAPSEPGEYFLDAECRNSTYEEELEFCSADEEEAPVSREADGFELVSYSKPVAPTWEWFDCQFEYYTAELTVGTDEAPTTTTPDTTTPPSDTPPPATPIVRPPDQTG